MADKFIEIRLSKGHYDICEPRAVQWLLVIDSQHGRASLHLNEDPLLGDWFGVEDAVTTMRKGYEHVWSGRKEADLTLLDLIMDNLDEFELLWHRQLLVRAQKDHSSAFKRVRSLQETIELCSR